MKKQRFVAVATAIGLGLTATIAMGAPASAAEYYVVESDLAEASDSPWYTNSPSDITFTDEGLVLENGGSIHFDHGSSRIDGDSLLALIRTIDIAGDGGWRFNTSWSGTQGESAHWGFIGPVTERSIPLEPNSEWYWVFAPTTRTLEEIIDEVNFLDGHYNDGFILNSYSVSSEAGSPVTLRSFSVSGDTYHFTSETQQVDDPEGEVDTGAGAGGVQDVEEVAAAPAVPVEAEVTFTG